MTLLPLLLGLINFLSSFISSVKSLFFIFFIFFFPDVMDDRWPDTCSALGRMGGCLHSDVQYVLVAILTCLGWAEVLGALLTFGR